METVNISAEIMKIVDLRRDGIMAYNSHHEAYAIVKDRAETAQKQANPDKLLKELWAAVKEGNDEAAAALASRLAKEARYAAAAFTELAAFADAMADM